MVFRFHRCWCEEENLKSLRSPWGMIKKMILRHTELEGEETDDHILPSSSLKYIWKWDCMHQGLVKIHNVSGYSVVQQTLMSTCNNMPGGLLSWISSKEFACQGRRHKRCRFDPWVGKIPWRRERQPTPVFLPEKSHGQGSLVGYRPRGHKRVGHDWAAEHTPMPCSINQFLFSESCWSLCPAPNWTKDRTPISGFLLTVILDSPFQGFLLKQETKSINHYRERMVLAAWRLRMPKASGKRL